MASPSDARSVEELLEAAESGDLELLKKLATELDNGEGLGKLFVRVTDDGGRTALHFAAFYGNTDICKYLIETVKLDVNLTDGKGETALHHATLGHNFSTAFFLIERDADPNAVNDMGFTALHYAAKKGCTELLRLLVSKGAEVEAKSNSGTPLYCAAIHGRKEAVKFLLDNKANPNTVCNHIFTPLIVSVIQKSFECVKLLLKAGADPNLGHCGVTPLGMDSIEEETEVTKCLLNAGADPNVTDKHDMTPLETAAMHGHHEKLMILFPVTSRIPTIPDWSLAGVIKHVHSEEAKKQRECKAKESFLMSKSKGEEAFKRKDFMNAIFWYTVAIDFDPSDVTVLSNRSLCWARLNEGTLALSDAEACVMMRPDWPKGHYREGVAWKLLKNFVRASEAFSEALKLDPGNKEIHNALRESVAAEFGVTVGENLRVMHL